MAELVAEHPLLPILCDAAQGRFPNADGGITILPPLQDSIHALIAFTGHAVVATDCPLADLTQLGADGFGGAMYTPVLMRLAEGERDISITNVLLVAHGRPSKKRLRPTDCYVDHPRVIYARRIKRNVRVFKASEGLVVIANGIAGRCEISVALDTYPSDRGHGRRLISSALGEFSENTPVFASVSPGNAQSLRAFLAEGFVPIGSEVILTPRI